MAASHEQWVAELLGDLRARDMAAAMTELAKVKKSVSRALGATTEDNK